MAWMHRDIQLPFLVLGAVVIANCSAPTPPADGRNCVIGNDGKVTCDGAAASGGAPGTGGSGTGGSSGGSVPMLSGGAGGAGGTVPMLSGGTAGAGGTVPMLSGGAGGATAGTGATSGMGGVGAGAGDTAMSGAGGSSAGVAGSDPAGGSAGMAGSPPTVTLGSIRVDALNLARDHTIVTFPFPQGAGKALVLKAMDGSLIPLQVGPADTNATFILPSLAAGMTATYTIEELSAPPAATVTTKEEASSVGNQLFVDIGATRVFRWTLNDDNFRGRAQNNVRSGYIYPLYTPGGLNVADDYAEDHPHMHGIWSAWTLTTFRDHPVDFWNGYANQGIVDLDAMEGAWSGVVHGGLIAQLDHLDRTTTPEVVVLDERWVVTVYKTHDGVAPYFIYDIDSVQQTATTDPLILEQYHYGGFGFRGAQEWAAASAVSYLTSEGDNRTSGDGQNAKWCAQYGQINGKTGGFAGLDHPGNLRHPQGLRIHPSNPYWAFVPVTPLKGGRYTLAVGTPLHSRYRVVAFDGAADAALLNRLWSDYGTPPTVTVLP